MTKLPRVSGRDVIKALSKIGFVFARQKGSHVVMIKQTSEGKIALVVPLHKEIDKGTLLEIIKQAKLTREVFLDLL